MDFTGVLTNVPAEALNHNRQEIQRITLLRNMMLQQGAHPIHLQPLDLLIHMNTMMITLGEEPLSHAGLVAMLQTRQNIRSTWAALNINYEA